MNRLAQGIVLIAVLAAAGLGFGYLYSLRISKGDVYPPYSSLRADPLGTRALHDGLEDLEGLHVQRRFKPLEGLPVSPPRTIILAGMTSGIGRRSPASNSPRSMPRCAVEAGLCLP